jgi:hypothetical protein
MESPEFNPQSHPPPRGVLLMLLGYGVGVRRWLDLFKAEGKAEKLVAFIRK